MYWHNTEVATQSAYSNIQYTAILYNKSLHEWSDYIHLKISSKSGWDYVKLNPGTFGFDSNIETIMAIFMYLQTTANPTIDGAAEACHDAWSSNYWYWVNNKPFKYNKAYRPSRKPLGDYRRTELSHTDFRYLPQIEKDKIRYFVKQIYDEIDRI